MGKSSVASLLTSVDELFTTQEERDAAKRETVVDIPLSEISDFPNHPFKVKMDEAMMEMADSIRQYGVLVPGMVRPKESGGYEMVAGHRRKMASELAQKPTMPCLVRDLRKMASELAQKPTMPCLVRDLTDDEAIIIMVDSNLQREKILPSEKASAYKMRLEAMKRQGQRTDLTSVPVAQKSTSRAELGKAVGESQDQVRRYIRLTNLIPPLLDMVDEGKIAMRPAVELSYLPENEQTTLHEMMELEDCTPSHAQTIKMRQFSENGKLTEEVILSIMQEEKPNQKEQFRMPRERISKEEKPNQKEQFRMPRERISKYFPTGTPAQKIEDTIVKALDMYYKRQRSMER